MDAKATFAKRFTELCGDKTQQEIADAIGVSRATVGYYLSGDRSPDIEVLSRIARYFGVTSDYLIGLSDSRSAEYYDAVKKLGLSESSIFYIEGLRKLKDHKPVDELDEKFGERFGTTSQLDVLELLLTNMGYRYGGLLSTIGELRYHMKHARSDKYMKTVELLKIGLEHEDDEESPYFLTSSYFSIAERVGWRAIDPIEYTAFLKYKIVEEFKSILSDVLSDCEPDYLKYVAEMDAKHYESLDDGENNDDLPF